MADTADLHMHSYYSDGVESPQRLAAMAAEAGLKAASLTDHDSMNGWPEFQAACRNEGVEPIPGVELSVQFGEREAHILGYLVRPESAVLVRSLEEYQQERYERAREMTEKLNGLGVPLVFDAVLEVAGRGAIGRPHVAEALFQSGLVRTYDEAFRRYIRIGCPAYVPKRRATVRDAIELIHEADGVALLAHPSRFYSEEDVSLLVGFGLDGVEVTHPKHRPERERFFKEMAAKKGLLVSGGSDYHGGGRGDAQVGSPRVDYAFIDAMRKRS